MPGRDRRVTSEHAHTPSRDAADLRRRPSLVRPAGPGLPLAREPRQHRQAGRLHRHRRHRHHLRAADRRHRPLGRVGHVPRAPRRGLRDARPRGRRRRRPRHRRPRRRAPRRHQRRRHRRPAHHPLHRDARDALRLPRVRRLPDRLAAVRLRPRHARLRPGVPRPGAPAHRLLRRPRAPRPRRR